MKLRLCYHIALLHWIGNRLDGVFREAQDALHDRVFQQLEELHFNPKSGNEERTNRFCHPEVRI
jgi:hypothetical protein